ncbi:FHA domain-containing protein [Bdellovibrionota bacterium FG-2]
MGNATKFKHAQVPRQPEERARLKIVLGADSGAIFVIKAESCVLGRGEDCDVVVPDLKASRRHVEVFNSGTGWSVKDLGSSNGILLNGKPSRGAFLQTGDTITLGETMLEFVAAEAGTLVLQAPARTNSNQALARVQDEAMKAQRERVRSLGKMGPAPAAASMSVAGIGVGGAGAGAVKAKDPKRLLLIGAAALGLFMLFGMEDKAPKKPKAKKTSAQEERNLASYLPGAGGDAMNEAERQAETFFKLGFREYREKNFLRAKGNFETALQVFPGHQLAPLYLENSEKQISDEVKFHLERGRKSFEGGRLKESKAHFETIQRLLYRDQTHASYLEATEQLERVIKAMRDGNFSEGGKGG